MCLKLIVLTCAIVFKVCVFCQRIWVPPTTTSGEMWNIFTWLKPYAIAASETVRDFFTKAQEIQNQLYVQARATNAFSWIPRLFGFSTSTKLEGPPCPSHQPGGFPDAAKLPALNPQKGGFQLKPVGKA